MLLSSSGTTVFISAPHTAYFTTNFSICILCKFKYAVICIIVPKHLALTVILTGCVASTVTISNLLCVPM